MCLENHTSIRKTKDFTTRWNGIFSKLKSQSAIISKLDKESSSRHKAQIQAQAVPVSLPWTCCSTRLRLCCWVDVVWIWDCSLRCWTKALCWVISSCRYTCCWFCCGWEFCRFILKPYDRQRVNKSNQDEQSLSTFYHLRIKIHLFIITNNWNKSWKLKGNTFTFKIKFHARS